MKQIKLKQINIRIFSGAVLKYIAMLTMLIDHIGATGLIFLSVGAGMSTRLYFISRMIGRIAFPIYVFLLVEGFVHTKNIKKYIIRLALFAIISEVPYDLAFYNTVFEIYHQNVMWELLICIIMLCCIRKYPDFSIIFVGVSCFTAWLLRFDYEFIGPLAVACIYLFRDRILYRNVATAIIFAFEPTAFFSLIPINMYSGKKGKDLKYLFYLFYPVHLLILFFLINMLQ